MKKIILLCSILLLTMSLQAKADEVEILAAMLIRQNQGEYLINVKVQHQDTGWEHYADEWRIVDSEGNILGRRVLHHPHVNEQPFTRALNNIKLNDTLTKLYIEAHDTQHGWAKQKLEIDLTQMKAGKLIVKSTP